MKTFKTFVLEDKDYEVGDTVVAIHPQQRYKTLTGLTVHKIHSNDKVTLKHKDGSLQTHDTKDVSKSYTKLNPNPAERPQFKEEYVEEDGVSMSAGPTNVTGPQSGTDPISATAVSPKKKKKALFYTKRNLPKI